MLTEFGKADSIWTLSGLKLVDLESNFDGAQNFQL